MFRTASVGGNIAKFKDAFRQRFRDIHTGQFHYMKFANSPKSEEWESSRIRR